MNRALRLGIYFTGIGLGMLLAHSLVEVERAQQLRRLAAALQAAVEQEPIE